MPKISAPTVGAHREAQRAALVRAATELLRESGLAGVSPRTVTERAGMARSSFYDYFPSKDDLVVAVAIVAFDRWNQEIDAALADVEPGLPRLRALVDATMRMTADGEHGLAGALRQAELSPTQFENLMALHEVLMRPVAAVMAEVGMPDRFLPLVQSALGSGVSLVQRGGDPVQAADDVFTLLTAGVPRA
ncbi:TetR family transcriptional regulator [Aeromicrobium sp. 636]|uniref:TetR/AcrR family transcriptional regulator n=1 Tax=Aeromicrobium senzhongii TaxID=2663859 RepID=A0A8I0K242_9ACTN|nr:MULTISPECIES: TetR/AcrR family transcriptional regulator [Aeromicrobium]MBC9225729.1 TetR/AcrR family transcriptional regulator [Aeromicrobium senzhongii]MCQ3997839.1 TetR family transcriptional regulator [Aeromicrobium sp. 636]MTB87767.1 TetR family transcriptional regulator [Aeromicrobium senzhongii]QNL95208.1 TetR/AcrR family transcriptional regulator [Aeromicrobium senzhongii]